MMFENYYSLNGLYTVVREIFSGLDALDAIKQGNPLQNGKVFENPDYMTEINFTPSTDLFNIDSSSGEVTLNNLPDFSTFGFGEFVVSVGDGTETI